MPELPEVEVVRAGLEPAHAVVDGVARGQHQHGRGDAAGAQLAAEREAVRLLRGMPDDTIVITLEVARVKLKPAADAPFAIGEVPQ